MGDIDNNILSSALLVLSFWQSAMGEPERALSQAMSSLSGSLSANSQYLASTWQQSGPVESDTGLRAVRYLQVIRDLAINPYWIGLSEYGADCSQSLERLGQQIDAMNRQLDSILTECLECFHAHQRPAVQIFAAPILPRAGIDGFCNLCVHPITLVVDPSRVARCDWYKLVIHELAHAMAYSAGHNEAFRTALAHLCLAYDLPEPPIDDSPGLLGSWPPYQVNAGRVWFWQPPIENDPSHY